MDNQELIKTPRKRDQLLMKGTDMYSVFRARVKRSCSAKSGRSLTKRFQLVLTSCRELALVFFRPLLWLLWRFYKAANVELTRALLQQSLQVPLFICCQLKIS